MCIIVNLENLKSIRKDILYHEKKLLYIVLIFISLNTFASPKKSLYDRILEKNDSFWIPEKCLKILHTEKKESIKKYFTNIETLTFYHELEEKTIQWDEQDRVSGRKKSIVK